MEPSSRRRKKGGDPPILDISKAAEAYGDESLGCLVNCGDGKGKMIYNIPIPIRGC